MSHLVGNDAGGEPEGVADHMQVIAELNKESYFASWASQQASVRRQQIEGAEEAQALDKITDEGVDRNHAIFFELSEGDMNRPAIGADGTQAVIG